MKTDTATKGRWIGVRRAGLRHRRGHAQPPRLRQRQRLGGLHLHLGDDHDDPRGLQNPGGSGRSATTGRAASSFTIDVNLADGQVHDLALYAVRLGYRGPQESRSR